FGWKVHVGPKANARSLANFPMQGNGAEMLRLACCLATERGDQLPKLDRSKPTAPTWYVIARDRAKLGAKWRPAYTMRTTMGQGRVRCPKCGTEQVDKAGIFLDASEFAKR